LVWVTVEAGLLIATAIVQKTQNYLHESLFELIGEEFKIRVFERALQLDVVQHESAEFHNKVEHALNSANLLFNTASSALRLAQGLISLVGVGVLLARWSVWAVAIVVVAGIPGLLMDTHFSRMKFYQATRDVSIWRRLHALQTLLLDGTSIRELKAFELGPMLTGRYRTALRDVTERQRKISRKRQRATTILECAGTILLYCGYGAAVVAAVAGRITLGNMTLYLQLFRQGQGAIASVFGTVGGIYSDQLRISTLFDFLDLKQQSPYGHELAGPRAAEGLRLECVDFSYPGSDKKTLHQVSLQVRAGESLALVGENGAGKSTLVKLILRMYTPTAGTITLDGLDLNAWDEQALRARMTVLFQDFNQYIFSAGENIGVGDVGALTDADRWKAAAEEGLARETVEALPEGYETQLGKLFGGTELSGGQWQKIALARAFMRKRADIVVLDEPTSAMDALAESRLMDQFKTLLKSRTAILISHKFSTVRLADRIAVLEGGRITELGDHASLIALGGHYARMYAVQADAYR
jgi:ABC-type multidrug transport system fused ATPase/permease subunit